LTALWCRETGQYCIKDDPIRLPLRSLRVGAGTWLLLTSACTSVRTVQPADLSPPNPLTRVWVTRADHTTVVLDSARVSADSLIGIVDGQPQRLRLSEATALRFREPAPDRTAGLVFLGASGVLALAVYLVDKKPPPGPCTLAAYCQSPLNDCCFPG
jgi:hypothetical protein